MSSPPEILKRASPAPELGDVRRRPEVARARRAAGQGRVRGEPYGRGCHLPSRALRSPSSGHCGSARP
eukprot:4985819-Alexandrium_andersonii.AAC.1